MAENGKIVFKLDELLKERNFPKYRLARDSGVDYRTVLRYCKGDVKNIKVYILEKLCDTLNCDIGDIIKFENKEKVIG